MTPRLSLTIDCSDPARLVPFWCAALAYEPEPPPPGHQTWRSYYLSLGETEADLGEGDACDRIIDPGGIRPSIWFQVVPEPKRTKNRVHLDVHQTDPGDPWQTRHATLAALAERLVGLGGRLRQPLPMTRDEHLVCRIDDPEGNELCLL